nr:uncharacterized mitochondrial protein AtMg00810-like [Tanacetum cinerariifolium]
MSSFNQHECLGCGQPCDGLYCYPCTCRQCGVSLINGICLNYTYRDGKPLISCKCEGPLRGGFCWFCASRVETSFVNDPNPNSFDESQNFPDYSPQPQNETYLCELYRNNSHYGYDCPPQFPLVYEQEPCYNQNFNENYYPHNLPSFLCRDNCGGPHKSFQCQSMNKNYFEPNPCYDSKSFGFDQPPQYSNVHQPSKEISIDELKIMMQSYWERMNQQYEHEALLAVQRDALNFKLLSINLKSQRLDKEKQEVKNILEHAPKRRTRFTKCLQNFKVIHRMISISNTSQISPVIANALVLPTEKPDNSLSMGDEHFSTISKTKSDEVIKSSVENLVPIPSESEVTSDNENEYTLIDSSPKFDYLLEEFSGELAHIDPIPLRIKEADFDLEEEIRLVENLVYDNSSPRPPKELNAEIADTLLESLSPSPIPVEDSDSLMEEIDLFLDTDELMPPGIKNDNYDSEGDIHFIEELLSNDTLSLPKNESSNFDHHDDPSFPRPPPKPLDVEIFFDFKPNTGVLTAKMVEDIFEHHVLMPKVLPFQLPFIQILLFCFRFHPKTRTKCSNLLLQEISLMVMQEQKHVMMQSSPDAGFKSSGDGDKKVTEEPRKEGGFEDPDFPDRVYKVEKALYGLHQAPRIWTASKAEGGWDFYQSRQDEDGKEVDVHLYKSMIGSLMYLTSLRPDIMFAVCACTRYQVNPKVSHLYVVKRIFRYLKGQPKLGLWYSKDLPFDLLAYTDSDYTGASLDMKSTIGGCQFFGCRLISWKCKK